MTQPKNPTELKTAVTFTIEQPGKDPHRMQVTMRSESPSGEDIVGLVQQLLIWAEDHYTPAARDDPQHSDAKFDHHASAT